jgi:Tfp pilus assembly protein PilX
MRREIKVSKGWAADEKVVMTALHFMLSAEQDGPWKKEHSEWWQLDGSNDWMAVLDGDTLTIQYRYGSSEYGAHKLQTLADWASVRFDPDRVFKSVAA